MVSRPQRSRYGHSRRGIRSRRADHRARGDAPDLERRSPSHVRLSGNRVSHRDGRLQLIYAKPSGRMETGWLDTNSLAGVAPVGARLFALGSSHDLAMVGAVAPSLS